MALKTLAWAPAASITGKTLTGYQVRNGTTVLKTVGVVLTTDHDFPDGSTYNVTVRAIFSDATYGSDTNTVVVDLSAPANKAIEFLQAQTDNLIIPLAFDFSTAFSFSMRFKIKTKGTTTSIIGYNTYPKMIFGAGDAPEYDPYFQINANATYITASQLLINTWYTMKMKMDPANHYLKRYLTTNETINESTDEIGVILSMTDVSNGTIQMGIGKHSTLANQGDWVIDWVDANGIIYNFDSITAGGVVTDENGLNPLTVISNRADVTAMIVDIV